MTRVETDTGLGVMCPGCWRVETAAETGGVAETVGDILFLRGWHREVVAETEDGQEVLEWLCPLCAQMGPPPRDVALGRFIDDA